MDNKTESYELIPMTYENLRELKPGDLVRHRESSQAMQVISDPLEGPTGYITVDACRLTCVTNPREWFIVRFPPDPPPPLTGLMVKLDGLRLGLFDGKSSSLDSKQLLMTVPGREAGMLQGDVAFGKVLATIHEDTEAFGEFTPLARLLAYSAQLFQECKRLSDPFNDDEETVERINRLVEKIDGTPEQTSGQLPQVHSAPPEGGS